MKSYLKITRSITITIAIILFTYAAINITNVYAQTFQINVQKAPNNLPYKITDVSSNFTGLEESNIAQSMGGQFANIQEDQVNFNFKIKFPESPGGKKYAIKDVNIYMKVTSIEDKSENLKTYTLEPYELLPHEIAGHKVLNGYVDIKGDSGIIYLNLGPQPATAPQQPATALKFDTTIPISTYIQTALF